MRVVEPPIGVPDLRLGQPELRCRLGRGGSCAVAHEGGVDAIANTQVELVHEASVPLQGETMNLGLRTILLLVAVVLFVLAVFSDTRWPDFIGLGLAAFAGAFLSDALGFADRTFSSTRDRNDTT